MIACGGQIGFAAVERLSVAVGVVRVAAGELTLGMAAGGVAGPAPIREAPATVVAAAAARLEGAESGFASVVSVAVGRGWVATIEDAASPEA